MKPVRSECQTALLPGCVDEEIVVSMWYNPRRCSECRPYADSAVEATVASLLCWGFNWVFHNPYCGTHHQYLSIRHGKLCVVILAITRHVFA